MVVIAITGSPGTGKSTLSDNLLLHYSMQSFKKNVHGKWKKYDVKQIISREKLYDSLDKDGTMVVDESRLTKFLLKELEKDSDYNVIIDSFFSHKLPCSIVNVCIVTVCDISILNKRLSERHYTMEKIRENLDCEIVDLCGQEAIESGHNVLYFDTSKDVLSTFVAKLDEYLYC